MDEISILENAAELLYNNNIKLLLEKVTTYEKRSRWRVFLDDAGLIVSLENCSKLDKAKENSFLLILPGKMGNPIFGSFNRLSGYQLAIAESLKKDIECLIATNEVAYCLTQVNKKMSTPITDGMVELSQRFGKMPTPKLQGVVSEELEASRAAIAKEREKEEIMKSIPTDVFSEYLQREKAKAQRKRKKRKHKKKSDHSTKVHAQKTKVPRLRTDYRYFKFFYWSNNTRYQFIQVYQNVETN